MGRQCAAKADSAAKKSRATEPDKAAKPGQESTPGKQTKKTDRENRPKNRAKPCAKGLAHRFRCPKGT